ncbi:hypothetical protein B8W95_14025, partial [Staphylococcus pasteuri]
VVEIAGNKWNVGSAGFVVREVEARDLVRRVPCDVGFECEVLVGQFDRRELLHVAAQSVRVSRQQMKPQLTD